MKPPRQWIDDLAGTREWKPYVPGFEGTNADESNVDPVFHEDRDLRGLVTSTDARREAVRGDRRRIILIAVTLKVSPLRRGPRDDELRGTLQACLDRTFGSCARRRAAPRG